MYAETSTLENPTNNVWHNCLNIGYAHWREKQNIHEITNKHHSDLLKVHKLEYS